MAFQTQESKNKDIVFVLGQDGQDVDIYANDVLIASFGGAFGRLELFECAPSEIATLPGLKFNADGKVDIEY